MNSCLNDSATAATATDPADAVADADDLESSWTLYFHDPDDRDWNFDSYTRVCTIFRASEFWGVHHRLAENNALGKGMWFIMRDDVFPCWDDKANIDGGCVSFMVGKADVSRVWQEFCETMLCECMRADGGEDYLEINGLSVSPKNDFCIIKVWLRSDSLSSTDKLRTGSHVGIFTSNRSKIANDTAHSKKTGD